MPLLTRFPYKRHPKKLAKGHHVINLCQSALPRTTFECAKPIVKRLTLNFLLFGHVPVHSGAKILKIVHELRPQNIEIVDRKNPIW